MQLSEPRTYETSTESKYEIAVKNFKLYQFMKESYHVWQTEEWTQKEPYKKEKKKRTLHYQKKI